MYAVVAAVWMVNTTVHDIKSGHTRAGEGKWELMKLVRNEQRVRGYKRQSIGVSSASEKKSSERIVATFAFF